MLLATACGPATEPIDLLPLLERGVFVPRSDLADLGGGNRPLAAPLPEFWLPLPVTPEDGWGISLRGWRPLGERSTLTLRRRTEGPAELVVELHRRPPEGTATAGSAMRGAAEPIEVTVGFDGRPAGRLTLATGTARGRFPVAAGAAGDGPRIDLRFAPPIRQAETGPQEIALRAVGLVPADAEPPARALRVRFDGAGRTLRFPGPGWLVAPLRLPEGARRLRCEVAVTGAGAAEASLRSWAIDAAGRRLALGEVGGGAGELDAPLASLAGQAIFLVLEADFDGPAGPRVVRPVIEVAAVARRGGAEEPRPGPAASAPPERLPDVLLVVLDAARGDRFLSGERRRRVAPGIDRVANEALVFTRAYSECPTTSCSIPNLITGSSFLPTGDVWRSPPLAAEATTLAEYLQRAGYRTVGYSASPSNSVRRGSAQGFDEFAELWGGDHPHHGPYGMSELAVGAIREQPADRPLYLQLHYLPPHEPYAPPPEFDRFTDPGYRGPVHPGMGLKPYKEGRASLAPADLAQLVGLYDGNLLMADDALGKVLAALRATGRWRRTLLVVTSDHGEAFMEHGHWGHNTTLYDEMLHVPLVVRLPGGARPAGVDTGRAVGLLDVVPTVLGRLGIAPAARVDGIDLLAPAERGARPLFHRTTDLKWPQLAVRSERWKLIAWPRHQVQQLFDLEADPGESRNLASHRPLLYAGLGLLVREQLERTLLRDLRADELGATGEEAEALRALGYLD